MTKLIKGNSLFTHYKRKNINSNSQSGLNKVSRIWPINGFILAQPPLTLSHPPPPKTTTTLQTSRMVASISESNKTTLSWVMPRGPNMLGPIYNKEAYSASKDCSVDILKELHTFKVPPCSLWKDWRMPPKQRNQNGISETPRSCPLERCATCTMLQILFLSYGEGGWRNRQGWKDCLYRSSGQYASRKRSTGIVNMTAVLRLV